MKLKNPFSKTTESANLISSNKDKILKDERDDLMNSKIGPLFFHKKIYKQLDSSLLSELLPPPSSFSSSCSSKTIIPTQATQGLREEFKKAFLPLLIDVFELRQMIDNYKKEIESPYPFQLENLSKSPKEILHQLEQLQKEIEESQRWCEGIILQIAKGIKEAKETLDVLKQGKSSVKSQKQEGFFFKLLKKWKR